MALLIMNKGWLNSIWERVGIMESPKKAAQTKAACELLEVIMDSC